jgi:CAAX protease family protein
MAYHPAPPPTLPPPPPPDPPELPDGVDPRPRWPAWYAPAGFLAAAGGVVLGLIVVGAVGEAIDAASGRDFDPESPIVTTIGTVIQAAVMIATAVFIASRTIRPKPWHFGLRGTRFWPAVGWSALGLFAFWAFVLVYGAVVHPSGKQTVTQDLGADRGAALMVAAAFVVIVIAPASEEFFFRGFFYGALRSRFGVIGAAAIDGVVFGGIHITSSDTVALAPILAALGFMFCLVYERTGSIFPTIALHALNNTIAYSVGVDGAPPVALPLGALVIAACALLPRLAAGPRPALR